MFPELMILRTVAEVLLGRLRAARGDDRGMTTETVIITALLAALAIATVVVITAKVTDWGDSIPDPST